MTHAEISNEFATMEQTRNSLLDKLSTYDSDTLNRKPADGGWSLIQLLEHMIKIERVSIDYIKKRLAEKSVTEKTGFKQWWRSLLLNGYLRSSKKFPAPVHVAPSIAYASLNEMREQWNSARHDLKEILDSIPENMLSHNWFKHPSVGKLNLMQMLTFIEAHHAHHDKQVWRTLKG